MNFQDSENRDFLIILKQMYLEYHLKRKNWQNLVDALFEVLYQYILSFSRQQERNSYVSGAMRQMIANLSNPKFDLEEMMDRIPLNQDYFRRLFQQHTGVTPLQFLTRKRVEFAQQLLRTRQVTGLSVKEIAWQSGFGDYYYFSRVFKKIAGVCPSQWQAESGKEYEPVIPPRS